MKKKVIALDLETIADKGMLDNLPEVKAKSNLKDPDKIAADIESKKKKQIQDMGLSPMLNMICCAGWCDENGPDNILLEEESAEGEKFLLKQLWEVLAKYDTFVTFNGRPFDLRCILLHGMAHGVRPAVNIDKGRYNRGNHIDLRQVLAGEDRFAPGKLDFFAKKFLKDHKTEGIDGKMVQDYWDMGLKQDIAIYCMQDCKLTFDLYVMAVVAGLIE